MNKRDIRLLAMVVLCPLLCAAAVVGADRRPLGPAALAVTSDGKHLFIGCAEAERLLAWDTEEAKVTWEVDVPGSPQGLCLSGDGKRLYVVCPAAQSTVCVIDVHQRRIAQKFYAGHGATALQVSADERRLYVCNRFDNDVSILETVSGRQLGRIKVVREPVAADLTPDGKTLAVANHLHSGPANTIRAAAKVSLIDTETGAVRNIELGEGAGLLRGIAVSPDGRFAVVTHLRSMYWLTTTEVDYGRMNCNALSFVDLAKGELLGTILLDYTTRGAANPWAAAWLDDNRTVVVSHAGSHELTLVDGPVNSDKASFVSLRLREYENAGPPSNFPAHRVRLRQRVPLPGNGPRAIAVSGNQVYVANYFSDDLCRVDLSQLDEPPEHFRLVDPPVLSARRRGEMLFNDGRLCYQQWQSCASCHDVDGRADALNWDLLNDGTGNPKNTKSLLQGHETAPAMALGVRASAGIAVRAGIRHILFTNATEETALAIDTWLKSLPPVPSPHLLEGGLSATAERGRRIFMSPETGCVSCHPPPLYTDKAAYDVGTGCEYQGMWDPAGADKPAERFDTPCLIELWRTAPYLHDGSAATLKEVLVERNRDDAHGRTSNLTTQELEDLIEFLLSL